MDREIGSCHVQLCPKNHGCNPAILEGGLDVMFSQGSEFGSPVPTSDLRSNDSYEWVLAKVNIGLPFIEN